MPSVELRAEKSRGRAVRLLQGLALGGEYGGRRDLLANMQPAGGSAASITAGFRQPDTPSYSPVLVVIGIATWLGEDASSLGMRIRSRIGSAIGRVVMDRMKWRESVPS